MRPEIFADDTCIWLELEWLLPQQIFQVLPRPINFHQLNSGGLPEHLHVAFTFMPRPSCPKTDNRDEAPVILAEEVRAEVGQEHVSQPVLYIVPCHSRLVSQAISPTETCERLEEATVRNGNV